jgi:surface protein
MDKPIENYTARTMARFYCGEIPKTAKRIIFTDQPVPEGITMLDEDGIANADNTLVLWREDDTYYISTQRPGKKITPPHLLNFFFQGRSQLEYMDASMLDMSEVWSTEYMFAKCTSLREIKGMETWDTSSIENMTSMFDGCESLENIDGLSSWSVEGVNHMNYMFYHCNSLRDISPLLSWHLSARTSYTKMFAACPNLCNTESFRTFLNRVAYLKLAGIEV